GWLPLLVGCVLPRSRPQLCLGGLLLGVAGASFAVALPLVSRWYPPEHQGLAMGLAGAGNSGTLFATLLAPRLARAFGWPQVFGLALVPLTAVLVAFACLARDPQARPAASGRAPYLRALRAADTGWLCLLYSLTFGGFVGMAAFLTIFFHDQYGVAKVHSGDLATLCILAGSFLRPVGGYLADRAGGAVALRWFLLGIAGLAGAVAT